MIRQGITTSYIGPTNTKGSRIKATARKGSTLGRAMAKTIPLDHSMSLGGRHAKAAKALAEELEWDGLWVAGGKPEEDGYMFVNLGVTRAEMASLIERERWVEDTDYFYIKRRDAQ